MERIDRKKIYDLGEEDWQRQVNRSEGESYSDYNSFRQSMSKADTRKFANDGPHCRIKGTRANNQKNIESYQNHFDDSEVIHDQDYLQEKTDEG